MHFEKGDLYHIYNRGNNSQKIFFCEENYLFFLEKIKEYVLPFSNIIAWCLMPTHFHLMVHVKNIEVTIAPELSTCKNLPQKIRSFNNSIAIMLRSYTRAIQKQENRTGSLFQNRTKAICLTTPTGIESAWFQTNYGTQLNTIHPEMGYPQVCFNYIHSNPAKHGLVASNTDWIYSSAKDYASLRNGKIINKKVALQYGLEF